MKDELQDKMVEILTSIQAATGKASDFALTQLPDVAQSYILYGRVASLIFIFGWVAALVVSLFITRYFWRETNEYGRNDPTGILLFGLISASFTFCSFVALNNAALVWFAPKVWLLKELTALIK